MSIPYVLFFLLLGFRWPVVPDAIGEAGGRCPLELTAGRLEMFLKAKPKRGISFVLNA